MFDLSLYVLTDPTLSKGRSHLEIVDAAVKGGATAIQFRDKHLSTRLFFEIGQKIKQICSAAGVTFIINDRLDVALALEADGVHLGPDDLPPDRVRELVPSNFIIGVSVDNVTEAKAATAQGANYLGAGPVFPTKTKLNTGPVMGLEGLAAVVNAVSIPVVGIGSIGPLNLSSVIGSGAAGAAVISAAVSVDDVRNAVANMRKIIETTRANTQDQNNKNRSTFK